MVFNTCIIMMKPPSFHSASDDHSTVAVWEAFRETAEATKQRKAQESRAAAGH